MALYENITRLKSQSKLESLIGKNINGDMLYQLTLQATESEQEASDALEQWVSNVCKDGQDTKTVVNLDTVNIIAGLGSLLVKDNG